MRSCVIFYLNGEKQVVDGEAALQTVSDYLRYQQGLTGTKVVCAEGDCGACTILVSRLERGNGNAQAATLGPYRTMNSCIAYVYSLHRSHVITVEGLKATGNSQGSAGLHPVQKSMVEHQGSQCGFCTPGFVCSLAAMVEDARREGFSIDEKRVRNYTTGNLCRCTGYLPILEAGTALDPAKTPALKTRFQDDRIAQELGAIPEATLRLASGSREVVLPLTLREALEEKSADPALRLGAGTTDLGVVSNKGKLKLQRVLGLHQIEDLHLIRETPEGYRIGARATLHQAEASLRKDFPEFSKLLRIFASPQIKNSATLVGNLMNASPIADTIPFLRVAGARVILNSVRGEREVDVNDFILPGYKQLDLKPDELVTGVFLPKSDHHFRLYKVSHRKDLDISAVTFAARYRIRTSTGASGSIPVFESFSLALGGVGPSVLRLPSIEAQVKGQPVSLPSPGSLFSTLAQSMHQVLKPLTDVRGSAAYRHQLAENLLLRFFDETAQEVGVSGWEASV